MKLQRKNFFLFRNRKNSKKLNVKSVMKIDVIGNVTLQGLLGNDVLTTTIAIIEETLEVEKGRRKMIEKNEAGEKSVMRRESTSLRENRGNLLKKGALGERTALIELRLSHLLVMREEEDLGTETVRGRIGVGLRTDRRGEGMTKKSVASPLKRQKRLTTGGEKIS